MVRAVEWQVGKAVAGVLVDLGGPGAAATQLTMVLAQQQPPPGQGEEFGKASPVGLVVILLLAVATVLLVRSMSKRIRRLPASFDPPPDGAPADGPDPQDRPADRPVDRNAEDAGGGRA